GHHDRVDVARGQPARGQAFENQHAATDLGDVDQDPPPADLDQRDAAEPEPSFVGVEGPALDEQIDPRARTVRHLALFSVVTPCPGHPDQGAVSSQPSRIVDTEKATDGLAITSSWCLPFRFYM